MKLLLDHCVPRPLKRHFPGHEVHTAFERGWAALKNGALLAAAEAEGFHLLITVDQNLGHQQNLVGRRIAVLVLVSSGIRVADLLPLLPDAVAAIDRFSPGEIVVIGPSS